MNFKGLALETGAVEKFIIIAFKYFVSTGRGRELIWGIKKKKKKGLYNTCSWRGETSDIYIFLTQYKEIHSILITCY